MKEFLNHYKGVLAMLILSIILLTPFKSFAHDAYFLQVLIDDHKYQYVGSVVEDNASWYQSESKHLEQELGKFQGLDEKVNPKKDGKDVKEAYEDYEKKLTNDAMIFTFAPVEVSSWGVAKNHATKADVEKAYKVQEALMASLNDALKVVNGGKPFTSIDKMIDKGNELARAINGSGTIKDYTITKGLKSGKPMKGLKAEDYIVITNKEGEEFQFPYRVKKGYQSKEGYEKDTEYLTWHQLMYQANYSYAVHGYTLRTASELVKPGPLEEAVVGMFESAFNQLRNLLGLYEINDLVFGEGIRGSSAFTHGIMPKDWSDTSLAYHWLFQALAWSLITFAIVKNLLQRNIATINPMMRVSLIESIQNLMVTGFLLAFAVPVINMLMFLNIQLVGVFGATAPNFSDLAGMNAYTNTLGGIIMQFVYLGIAIYLNFVYIMRAITIAILIATAPLFIVTIAFGGKWKQLFGTWMRELVGNIYLQSFHAFMLSFFFAITTSSRGIEGLVVLMALIPMTEFFRGLVMGQGGGIAHAMGMKSMSQASSMVGGAFANNRSSKHNGRNSEKDGSSRETSNTNLNDSGMGDVKNNSDKIKNNSESMNQRQRMNATQNANSQREMPLNVADNAKHPDREKFMNTEMPTSPQGFKEVMNDKVQAVKENVQGAKEKVSESKTGNALGAVANGAKAVVGAGQVAVGASMAMATGDDAGMQLARRGVQNAKSGSSAMGLNIKKTLPESTKAYSTVLPNGDLQVHRKSSEMAKQGVVGASMEGSGKSSVAKYTYDMNKFSSQDKSNLTDAYDAFKRNDTNAIKHYQSEGIQNMTKNNDGNLVVRYNQTGMDKMGIKSVQTIGAGGNNARIVETKPAYAHNTPVTFELPKYNAPSNPQNNGNKEKTPN